MLQGWAAHLPPPNLSTTITQNPACPSREAAAKMNLNKAGTLDGMDPKACQNPV